MATEAYSRNERWSDREVQNVSVEVNHQALEGYLQTFHYGLGALTFQEGKVASQHPICRYPLCSFSKNKQGLENTLQLP